MPGDIAAQIGSISIPGSLKADLGLNYCCFAGFAPNQELQIDVSRPDGTVVHDSVLTDEEGEGPWNWYALPGDPLGQYVITATQPGVAPASAVFTETLASSPHALVLPLNVPPTNLPALYTVTGSPGTTFHIALGGFQPHQSVTLYLYGGSYLTTLAPAETDDNGTAVYALPTESDDPVGGYAVVTDPPGTLNLVDGDPLPSYVASFALATAQIG